MIRIQILVKAFLSLNFLLLKKQNINYLSEKILTVFIINQIFFKLKLYLFC